MRAGHISHLLKSHGSVSHASRDMLGQFLGVLLLIRQRRPIYALEPKAWSSSEQYTQEMTLISLQES